jgi:sugar/nucleoside kinase (ribokinase family)
MGPKIVIIKMGSKGSLLITSENSIKIPCIPNIDVYDPTGAGDSFAGGFIGYISKYGEKNMIEALLYASSVASFTVSDFGINKILNLNLKDIESRVEILRTMI